MTTNPTTGIPNPDKPGRWLVPPWPARASFSAVVEHFHRFDPGRKASTAQLLAYFERFEAALDAAPAEKPASWFHQRWCADMRACVTRCVRLYREKHAADAGNSGSALQAPAQTSYRVPPHHEKAS